MLAKYPRKRLSVAPDKTLMLMKSLGPTRAAQALGVSTTTLYKARATGEVSKVLEIAAEGALSGTLSHSLARTVTEPEAPAPAAPEAVKWPSVAIKEPMALCLVEVPRAKLSMIERLAKALGAVSVSD